jgi:hypothetical protein
MHKLSSPVALLVGAAVAVALALAAVTFATVPTSADAAPATVAVAEGSGKQVAVAGYNNAPASLICAYHAASFERYSPYDHVVTTCRDINFFGHFAVHIVIFVPALGCYIEDVYDRHNGAVTPISYGCL